MHLIRCTAQSRCQVSLVDPRDPYETTVKGPQQIVPCGLRISPTAGSSGSCCAQSTPDAMQIGEKGTKYGLQVRGPARPAAKQPAVKPVAAAFAGGSDSEEEDNVGAQVARQAMRKQSDAKVQAVRLGAAAARNISSWGTSCSISMARSFC